MAQRKKHQTRAGVGGFWAVSNEVPDSATIAQQGTHHCCAAAIEMVLAARGIAANQLEIANRIGTPTLIGDLDPELARLDPNRIWTIGNFQPETLPYLLRRTPWIALMKSFGNNDLHAVVVDGANANGNLQIRDPWPPGTAYTMTLENFYGLQHGWSGLAIYAKQLRPHRRKRKQSP